MNFTIEERAGIVVVEWAEGGCRPATDVEIAQDAEIARLKGEVDEAKLRIRALRWAKDGIAKDLAAAREELEKWKRGYTRLEGLIAHHESSAKMAWEEVERLKKLNLSSLCAYCGTFFEADADGRKVDALQAHMKVCEKHPMRAVEARAESLEAKVEKAIGENIYLSLENTMKRFR